MERKQILEILKGHCAGVTSTKENGLFATKVYLDDLADELVNLFAVHNTVKQSEQLCEVYHSTDFNGKCFKCGEQVFVSGIVPVR